MRSKNLLPLLLALSCSLACSKPEPEPQKDPSTTAPAPAPEPAPTKSAAPAPAPSPSPAPGPLVLAPKGIRFTHAPTGEDVVAIIKAERAKATANARDLVVYVGAKWCEPCQRFHKAAERGDLDSDFPSLTVLEFDVDEDRERLLTGGYESKYLPFFVVPDANGRATDKRFEGSVKGDGAVLNIAPRLRMILAK